MFHNTPPRSFRSLALIVPALLLLGIGWFALLPLDSADPPAEGAASDRPSKPAAAAPLAPANHEPLQLVATQVPPDARAAATLGPLLPVDFLDRCVTDKTIAFALPDGTKAEGAVEMIDRDAKGILFVQGRLTRPAPGSYFLQRQTVVGVAGPFVGNVRFDGKDTAWKIEPTADGQAARFVARKLDDVICANFEKIPADADPAEGDVAEVPQNHPTTIPIPAYQTVIPLQSLPGATAVVYLDFDGEPGPFPGWGTFDAAPSGASNTQVFEVWKMVCEDYQAFNVNITTDRKVFDNAPAGRRQQIIISPTTTAAPGAGGVAYVGSFNWAESRPCWAFYSTGKSSCEVISHEVGHTLGLSHDGRISPSEGYYGGHGSGDTGWAPIMGVGYYQKLSQWSKGEYLSANQTQDDLNIIVSNNNDVDYRVDDAGETLAAAPYLEISATNTVTNEGIIETTGDIDAFRFVTSGGLATLNVNPVTTNPNLDIAAEVVAATAGTVMASDNPDLGISAAISVTLPAGEYLLKVRGTGRGDPLVDGYTNYGCLGSYLISGSVVGGLKPDRFSLAENSASGTSVGAVAARASHGAATLTYAIASGNTGGAFAINAATGAITVAATAALNYEALSLRWDDPATFQLFVTISDSLNAALNESIRVVVTVTNANETPVMAAAAATILEHTYPGTKVLSLAATDPDRFDFATYSITAGNTGNVFAINAGTGQLTVAADIEIAANTVYNLTVKATDQGTPALFTTVTVPVTVVNITAGYQPGRIVRTYFENIGSGGTVANLTGNAKFPNSPDSEAFLTACDGLAHGDNFGSTLRGYLIPPTTGSYQFWIASDDASELRLSTNATPASATVKATVAGWTNQYAWTANASQQSGTITLTAGQPYYLEVRHKEGGGGDHVAVAWSGPGLTRQVISGLYLAPFYQNYAPKITAATFAVRENALVGQPVGTATASDVNAQDTFSAYAITGGNTGGVFGINPATGQLTVAQSGLLNATTTPSYTLTIRTTDNGTPALNGTGTVTVTVSPAAGITQTGVVQELWTGITGTALTGLTGNANYPNRPTLRRSLTDFDSVSDYADNYGSRIRAKFIPPVSGDYKFYVSGDDESRLLFSANATGSGAAQIANVSGYSSHNEWTKFTSQTSAVKTLVAGQAVYLEALQKEGGGGDHISVGYTSSATTTITVIPGSMLQPFNLNVSPGFSPASYTFNLNGGTATAGTTIGTPTATDPNGEPLVYAILSGNAAGAFAINAATGALTVANPAMLTSGDTTLQVAAQDGGLAAVYPLASATASVVVRVTGMNVPPVFTANPIVKPAATENVAYSQSLTGSATDANAGDPLTFTKTSGPTWLTVAPTGALSGTPADANTGANSFGVRVTDSAGAFAEATLTINVIGVNHPPAFTIDPISASLLQDTPLAGLLTATDADATETLTFSKVSGPAWLTVAANGSFAGTPAAGTAGANVFIVRVTDPTGLFDEATLNALVVASPTWLNPAGGSWPTAGNWFAGVSASGIDVTADFSTLDLTSNATVTLDGSRTIGHLIFGDATPSHHWTLATGSGGSLSLNVSTGTPTITVTNQSATINTGLAGSKGFAKTGAGTLILAGTGLYTGTTNVKDGSLLVNGTLNNSAVTVATAGTLGGTGSLLGAVSLDGTLAPGNAGIGTLTNVNVLTLNSASAIKWEIADWNGTAGTGFDTVIISALALNATAANPIVIRISERALANFSESRKAFTLIQSASPITGFDPAKFTVDTTGFTSGAGAWSIRQTGNLLELVYTRPNTAPAFAAGPFAEAATEDTPFAGQLAAIDPDFGETLIYSLVSGPAWLTVSNTGAFSGTPTNENVGPNSFTVQVTDAANASATAVLTITVANTNDAPAFAAGPFAEAATEDTPFTGQLAAADPDAGETLAYALVSGPAWLTVSNTGALSGTPTNENVGPNAFTVQVADAANASATAVLTITVANTNDAPAFAASSITGLPGTQGAAYSGTLVGTATDVDAGDVLNFSKGGGPTWLAIAADGTLTGTPGPDDTGLQSFVVKVADAANTSASATLEIQIAATISSDANGNGILDSWETAMFGNADPGSNAATADPDGDGLSNLMEYALDTRPLQANAGPLTADLELVDGARYLRLALPKNPVATNLTFTVETGGDLTDWSATTTTLETDTSIQLVVRDTIAQSAAIQRFIRLKVAIKP
jgi:autotransporter-associated beta strand protein